MQKSAVAPTEPCIRLVGGLGLGQAAGMDDPHAEPRRIFNLAAWILRIGLGGWFVSSGAIKLWWSGLDRFTRDIGNYHLPWIQPPLDAVAAYTVPWVEIVAGLCLMLGFWRRATLGVFGGLVAVFAVCVGWAWLQGLDIACGCHGDGEPIHYWGKVAEFAGYYLAFGLLWWHETGGSERPKMGQ